MCKYLYKKFSYWNMNVNKWVEENRGVKQILFYSEQTKTVQAESHTTV